jgi:hypothetical protein
MPFLLQQHPSPEDGSLTLPSPADLLLLLVPSPPTHQRRIVSWFFSHILEHSVFLKIQWKKKRPHVLQIAEHRHYHYLFIIIIIRIQVAPPITPTLLRRYENFL